MVVGGLIVIPTLDNANALVSHDLVTKIKNFVKSLKDKITNGGHGHPSGGEGSGHGSPGGSLFSINF